MKTYKRKIVKTNATDKQLDQFYYVSAIEYKDNSRWNGKPFWEIEFTGVRDRRRYITYVQTTMENYPQWADIIANEHLDQMMQFNPLRIKETERSRIIDADSQPIKKVNSDIKGEIAQIVLEQWDEEDNKSTSFGRLFK